MLIWLLAAVTLLVAAGLVIGLLGLRVWRRGTVLLREFADLAVEVRASTSRLQHPDHGRST